MKNLYPKSKGKIYPSPSSSPTAASPSFSSISPSSPAHVLNLLPAAILALISVLGFDDREVLAYLILRSMKTPSLMLEEKKKCKKPPHAASPLLDCPCFDCYTSFWIRWDSSPNRELIHQAIEAFEEHLAKGETPRKSGRKKDRRLPHKDKRPQHKLGFPPPDAAVAAAAAAADGPTAVSDHETTTTTTTSLEKKDYDDDEEGEEAEVVVGSPQTPDPLVPENVYVVPPPQLPAGNHRGLVRKVWPDVMGMFNSRLWGLWSPTA